MTIPTIKRCMNEWRGAQYAWQGDRQHACRCSTCIVTDCAHFVAHVLQEAAVLGPIEWPHYDRLGRGCRTKLIAALDRQPELTRLYAVSPALLESGKQLIHHRLPALQTGDVLLFLQGTDDAHVALMYDASNIIHCAPRLGVQIVALNQINLLDRLAIVWRGREVTV